MFLLESWILSKCCFKILSWLAIICRAVTKLSEFPQLSSFRTSLSLRRETHCRLQKIMASETQLTMCLFLIMYFRFSSSIQLPWVFKRIKEGIGYRRDHCVVMVLHLVMPICLFWKFRPMYEGLLTKAPLSFLQCIRIIKTQNTSTH